MSARGLLLIALALLGVTLLLVLIDVPRWLPPRVQPLPLDMAVAAPARVTRPPPLPGCTSHRQKLCWGGDVWWHDSCGRREDPDERCDDAVCSEGKCQRQTGPACGKLSEGGRCDGNLLRWCDRGIAREVDCAQSGRRCRLDLDGEPRCIKVESCSADECIGPIFQVCEKGVARHGYCPKGRCELDDNGRARCVRKLSAEKLRLDPCHGCACPSPSPELEPLPPLEVVVFLTADENGNPVESEERARAAVAQAAEWLAAPGHDTGLRIVLRDIRTIIRPTWISGGFDQVREAERDPELHPRDFIVPVVFVRELHVGDKTTSGLGTFPDGTCADMRMYLPRRDGEGVIFLGRRRYPTTLAHELGHYLGLCHTHQPDLQVPVMTLREDGSAIDCGPCSKSGDGVCDTPIDPGVDDEGCTLDETTCTVSCVNGAAPDPNNLMSYFVPCRRYFSDEQSAYMRRWAQWRLRTHPH